jgi:hypothetical protein
MKQVMVCGRQVDTGRGYKFVHLFLLGILKGRDHVVGYGRIIYMEGNIWKEIVCGLDLCDMK